MAENSSIRALVELFSFLDSPSEPVFAKAMFGGHLIYCGEAAFVLVADGTAYLKTDEVNREDFQKAGGEPFVYGKNGKEVVMSFWTSPAGSLDSGQKIRPWAESALAAAKRALKKKKKKR
jgi:DNA transformation protein